MPRKIDGLDVDDFIERYRSGESCTHIGRVHQVSADVVRDRLTHRGISELRRPHTYVKKRGRLRTDIDLNDLVRRYDEGASILALSREFSLARTAVTKRIKDSGRTLRSASEANRLRMQRLDFTRRSERAPGEIGRAPV